MGRLPEYPEPRHRQDLFLILGELHHQNEAAPAAHPRWLSIPEKGLYTGVAALGAIGSGKTRDLILPAMYQLFGYKPHDPQKKLSGIVLEVKGDLCRHLARILKRYGREQDYIDVSLDSNIRYNPLNNDLDPSMLRHSISPRSSLPSGAKGKNRSGSSPTPTSSAMSSCFTAFNLDTSRWWTFFAL